MTYPTFDSMKAIADASIKTAAEVFATLKQQMADPDKVLQGWREFDGKTLFKFYVEGFIQVEDLKNEMEAFEQAGLSLVDARQHISPIPPPTVDYTDFVQEGDGLPSTHWTEFTFKKLV